MRVVIKCLLLAFTLMGLSACQTVKGWFAWGDDASAGAEHPVGDAGNVRSATNSELEQKLASLRAKVDELEQQSLKNKARIRILEKGLLLGIIPDELKNPDDLDYERKIKQEELPAADHGKKDPPKKEEKISSQPAHPPTSEQPLPAPNETRDYQTLLTAAQDNFQQGRYGQAVADFSALGRHFPNETKNGNHKFWIALSWANMREYETAQKQFSEFIRDHADNAWIPRAKFHLAKTEYKLGYREKALESMRSVIKEYPNEDAAEMAKAEIANLEKSL